MPRKAPPPPVTTQDIEPNEPEPLVDVTLHVVTPMFGGGWDTADAQKPVAGYRDDDLPLRPATIRGHLRFWWRACVAHTFATPESLFATEELIWGSTARHSGSTIDGGPSGLSVSVTILDKGEGARYATSCHFQRNAGNYRLGNRTDWPSYVLFPFADATTFTSESDCRKSLGAAPEVARLGARFRLELTPSPGAKLDNNRLRAEAERAIWAWIAFGGVGARTRRGCGSLWCAKDHLDPQGESNRFAPQTDAYAWITTKADTHILAQLPSPLNSFQTLMPKLHAAEVRLKGRPVSTDEAWKAAVNEMSVFRQGDGVGRNGARGASFWPEANSIRTPGPNGFFSRLNLGGGPIVFQRLWGNPRHQVTLEPSETGMSRMASPIVLKPLAISSTQAVPLALRLNAPHVGDTDTPAVQLRKWDGVKTAIPANQIFDSGNARNVPTPLQAKLAGRISAREAFMDWLGSNQGWTTGGRLR